MRPIPDHARRLDAVDRPRNPSKRSIQRQSHRSPRAPRPRAIATPSCRSHRREASNPICGPRQRRSAARRANAGAIPSDELASAATGQPGALEGAAARRRGSQSPHPRHPPVVRPIARRLVIAANRRVGMKPDSIPAAACGACSRSSGAPSAGLPPKTPRNGRRAHRNIRCR